MFYLRFLKKQNFRKNERIAQFRSFPLISSFWVSDVCESLISLKSNERCERMAHFAHQKWATMSDSLRSLRGNERMSDSLKKMSDSLIRSFLVSDLSQSLTIAHFLWATWANCSWSLIFGQRNERLPQIAHFKLSDLSDSLMVAHLSWAIWANCSQWLIWFERNEWMSDEQMSEFPALTNTIPTVQIVACKDSDWFSDSEL